MTSATPPTAPSSPHPTLTQDHALADTRVILEARNIHKHFRDASGKDLQVLDNVSLKIREGEIVALLGRSGSGKSTLLRCLMGLLRPTSGEVRYAGKQVTGPMPGMAMVFQSFALFPWLTVQQNVELGLLAKAVPETDRAKQAVEAIDLIGLDGFESAFPKEISGGMRQRVGFARALVVKPDVLLMDEPFSALDVLTAENLRTDLVDLWANRKIPTKSILLVTHNIEEAVFMADRIIVLAANPGRIKAEVAIPLVHPRDRDDHAFRALVDRVYNIMTTPGTRTGAAPLSADKANLAFRLPSVPLGQIVGLIERVATGIQYGKEDLPRLASEMHMEIDDLFPVTDAADILGLAMIRDGDIILLPAGQALAAVGLQEQKKIFAQQALKRVALIAHIRRVLTQRPDHRAPEDRFLRELEDTVTEDEAARTLTTAIEWGRYAEVFDYDSARRVLFLDPNAAPTILPAPPTTPPQGTPAVEHPTQLPVAPTKSRKRGRKKPE